MEVVVEKRKKKIEKRPSIDEFVRLFCEAKSLYQQIYDINSNREYIIYITRRYQYKRDLQEFTIKVKEIRDFFDDHERDVLIGRELQYFRILQFSERKLESLLEDPVLENHTFEEWTLHKNDLTTQLHSILQQIQSIWKLDIPIYLLQKESVDEVLAELKERGFIS